LQGGFHEDPCIDLNAKKEYGSTRRDTEKQQKHLFTRFFIFKVIAQWGFG